MEFHPTQKSWEDPPTHQRSPPLDSSTPTVYLSRTTTSSEILAAFSPQAQPKKQAPQAFNSSAPRLHPIAMKAKRDLRLKEPVSYEISSDSDGTETSKAADSSFSSPDKPRRTRIHVVDIDDELEEIEPPKTPSPRLSSAGHSLRQHTDLHLSLRAQENGDKPIRKKRKISHGATVNSQVGSEISVHPRPKTERHYIRDQIATETAGKRAKFFVDQKDLFLPLLPDGNHIQKLLDQRAQTQQGNQNLSVPYEALQQQPLGFVVTSGH